MFRFFVVLAICLASATAADKAIVVLTGTSNVTGKITFTETSDGAILIEGQVVGLTEGKHGFHVHALGDLSNGCTSTGAHFNPENATHGAQNATVRHVGDLGNIEANAEGVANVSITDKIITLSGKNSIIGRGVVVHEKEDDLGLGGHELSSTTGNAGNRLACGIIGILEEETSNSTATTLVASTLTLTTVVAITTLNLFKNV